MHTPVSPTLALSCVLAYGCQQRAANATPIPEVSHALAPQRPDALPVATPDAGDVCESLRARFSATLASGSGRCARATDCSCYNPVAAGLGCGGVTDATTATALHAIEADFHRAHCRWPVQCGPWACAPQCLRGRCSR